MDKIVKLVRKNNNEYFYVDHIFSLAISACSSTICASPKICSEQSSGPICTCAGNKVGTFCQYGKYEDFF
jgi:hypothetical protein